MSCETRELQKTLARHNIKGGAFDNDDVLSNTNPLFKNTVETSIGQLSDASGIDEEEMRAAFQRLNEHVFETHRVHPSRWQAVISGLRKKYKNIPEDALDNARELLMDIYNQAPELNEGAVETLDILKTAGLKLVMVTHRYRPWHNKVMSVQGIGGMFDEITVVGSRRLKVASDWERTILRAGLLCKECLGVEDRTKGLWEMYAVGVSSLWKVTGKWKFYTQGETPPGTHEINSIKDLVPGLLQMG